MTVAMVMTVAAVMALAAVAISVVAGAVMPAVHEHIAGIAVPKPAGIVPIVTAR